MAKNTKQIIIAIVIIAVIFVAYKIFFPNKDSVDVALVADTGTPVQFADGQVILAMLDQLNSVTLDDSVFSDKVFVSLKSFERGLDTQVAGRKNPFLPIGIENSAVVAPKSTSTSKAK